MSSLLDHSNVCKEGECASHPPDDLTIRGDKATLPTSRKHLWCHRVKEKGMKKGITKVHCEPVQWFHSMGLI